MNNLSLILYNLYLIRCGVHDALEFQKYKPMVQKELERLDETIDALEKIKTRIAKLSEQLKSKELHALVFIPEPEGE